MFKTVQQEYQEEGLEWESIGFQDNAEVLEMIEGHKKGIIAILNEGSQPVRCLIIYHENYSVRFDFLCYFNCTVLPNPLVGNDVR